MHLFARLRSISVPLLCGAFFCVSVAAQDGSGARPGGFEDHRLIIGLAPDTPLAAEWTEEAKVSAEVAPESPLARALEALVGLPIRDIRLGSGRTVSFVPDWQKMGAPQEDGRILIKLADVRLADALSVRLNPTSRTDDRMSLRIDPDRTLAAIADWLGSFESLTYAQTDAIVTIER